MKNILEVSPESTREAIKDVTSTELPRVDYSVMDAMREGAKVTGPLINAFAAESSTGLNTCALSSAVLAASARGYM